MNDDTKLNYKTITENTAISSFIKTIPAICKLTEYEPEEIESNTSRKLFLNKRYQNSSLLQQTPNTPIFRTGIGKIPPEEKFPLPSEAPFLITSGHQNIIALNIIEKNPEKSPASGIQVKKSCREQKPDLQFDQLFYRNPSPGWIIDDHSLQFLAVNETAVKNYGYSQEEFLKMTVMDILPADEFQRLTALLKINPCLVSAYSGQWKNQTKEGKIIHVNIPANISDTHNRIIILGIDITERIQREEQKEFDNLQKEALFNSTLDQIWSLDRDFTLLAANKSFIKLLESATGLVFKPGDNFMDHLFTRDFVKLWDNQFNRALGGERIKEVVYIPEYSNLPARWVELMINAIIKKQEIVGVVCYTRNITENKIAEEKLIDSEANLKEAQRMAMLGNWSRNLKTGEISWSDQLFEIFEIDKNYFCNDLNIFLNLVDEADKKKLITTFRQTEVTGESYFIVYKITTSSGKRKIIEEIGYGQKDENGNIFRIIGTAQDITKSMLTEEALKLSYEKYHLVAKATNDSIWDWDMQSGMVTRSGDGFKILFGYDNDFANEKDTIYNKLIHPEDLPEIVQTQGEILQTPLENYWEAEYRFLKANGDYAYVFDRGYIVRDDKGMPVRMIGASQDITIQKEQLKEIKRIKGNLQALINTTEDLIWSVDADLKLITANNPFKESIKNDQDLQYISEGEEVLISSFNKETNKFWKTQYKKALHGERFDVEYEYESQIRKRWTYSIVSFSPIINKDGKISGVACFSKDITELKLAGEELKQSQKRFKDLFQLTPQPMWLYECDSLKIVEINQSAINHYGYSEKEFLNMSILDIRPKDRVQGDLLIIQKRRKSIQTNFNEKFTHIKKNGELIEVQIFSTPIEIEKKKHKLVIAIDNTEKIKNEHNINKAIIKAQENERYEIGSELHDNICQLLASSKMRLSILKEYIPKEKKFLYNESNEYLVNALEEIRNLSHRLAPSFFNDKTLEEAFTRLFNSFNFSDKYDIQLSFCEKLEKQNISLELKLNLYRILQEQLRNIFKYAKASKIVVEVAATNKVLHMRTCDDGIGFNLSKIKSGIGLSNITRRVELFSGKVLINTSPGNGTEILINIPLA